MTDRAVLTARHVVADAARVQVRFDADRPGEWTADATLAWSGAEHDLAVLRIEPGKRRVAPARFGSLSDRRAVIDVHAAGYPRWKLRQATDGRPYRDLHDAEGRVAVLSNRRSGTLEITVSPPGEDPDPAISPWSAMSGAAVWAGDRIIGVVAEHHRAEGLNHLTAVRIDRGLGDVALAALLGIADPRHLVDVIPPLTGTQVRSGYLEQVRDIAPAQGLHGRENELDALAAFCSGDEPYVWWQAGPWAGKSALMSTFVLNPPNGVDVVSFFVTGRLASQSDSEAFTDALLEQLNALLGDAPLPSLSRDPHRRALLRRAAERCKQDGRRLVLVVDGLDEDLGAAATSRVPSIASLLPKDPGDGLRVILSGRRHPPIPDDVPSDHPLRACPVHELTTSPHARAIEHDATRELQRLLNGDRSHVDILGFITASGGGLSKDDLIELTGLAPFALMSTMHSAFGRTVTRREPVYLFAHDTLRTTAEAELGGALLAGYRSRIHDWAGGYHTAGWPEHTPAYLLNDYPRMLFAAGAADRLVTCATDPARHVRLLETTGGDAAAIAEIRAAHDLCVVQPDPDLLAIARLTIQRERLAARNSNIPTDLPAVWAALGNVDRAESLARSIADPRRQALALTGVVEAIGRSARYEEAATVAAGIADPSQRDWALANLVEEAANAGAYEPAAAILDRLADPERRAWALAALVDVAHAAGRFDDARRFALAATEACGPALVAVVRTIAGTDVDLAAAIARDAGNPAAVCAVVEAAVSAADYERAASLAREITVPERRTWALTTVMHAAMAAGNYGWAGELVDELENADLRAFGQRLLRTVTPDPNAPLVPAGSPLVPAGSPLVPAGSPEPAPAPAPARIAPRERSAVAARKPPIEPSGAPLDPLNEELEAALNEGRLEDAASVALRMAGNEARAAVLATVVRRLSAVGSCDLAAELIAEIGSPHYAASARTALAVALATSGRRAEAIALVNAVAELDLRASALTSVARSVAMQGDVEAATALAEHIADPAHRAFAFGAIVRGLTDVGLHDQAGDAIDRASAVTTIPSAPGRAWVLSTLAVAAWARRERGRALHFAALIDDPVFDRRCVMSLPGITTTEGLADAATLTTTMDDPGARAHGLAALVDVALHLGDDDMLRRLAREAAAAARTIDRARREPLLARLAGQLAEAGHVGDALAFTLGIDDASRRASILVALAGALVDAGLADDAAASVDAEPTRVLIALATASAAAGDYERAVVLVHRIPDAPVRTAIALALMDTIEAAGRLELAGAVARDVNDPVVQAFVLRRHVELAVEAGDLDRAAALGRVIVDPVEQASALVGVITRLVAAGNADRAVAVARAIGDAGQRSAALRDLVVVMLGAGQREAALAIERDIVEPAIRAEALAAVVEHDVEAAAFDSAMDIAMEIDDPGRRAEVVTRLAAEAARAGARELALRAAMAAASTARDIENTLWRQDALGGVLEACMAAGEYDRAGRLGRALVHSERRSVVLTLLADIATATGKFEKAAALIAEIEDAHRRHWAMTALVEAAVRAGHSDLALTLAESVDEPAGQAVVRVAVGDAALAVGRRDLARQCCQAAMGSLNEIDDGAVRLLILVAVARMMATVGDFEEASALAPTILESAAATGVPPVRGRGVREPSSGAAARYPDLMSRAIVVALPEPEATDPAEAGATSARSAMARWRSRFSLGRRGTAPWAIPGISFADGPAEWGIGVVATALAEAGEAERCIAVIRQVDGRAAQANILTDVAQLVAVTGRLQVAFRLAVAAAEHATRFEGLVTTTSMAVRQGRTDLAREALSEVPPPSRLLALRSVADGVTSVAEATAVLALARNVLAETDWPLQRTAITAVARAGDHAGARALLSECGIGDDERALATLAAAGAGRVEVALDWLDDKPGAALRRLGELARTFADSGRLTDTLMFVRRQATGPDRSVAFISLIGLMVDAGHVGRAIDLAGEFIDGEPLARALALIAPRLTDAEHRERVASLLDRAHSRACSRSDPTAQARELETLVQVLVDLRRLGEAQALAQQITTPVQRAHAMNVLAQAMAVADRIPEALDIARQASGPVHRAVMLVAIAKTLAMAGRTDHALTVVDEIDDDFERADGLVMLVKGLSGDGLHDEAAAMAAAVGPTLAAVPDEGWRDWAAQVLDEARLARDRPPTEAAAIAAAKVAVAAGQHRRAARLANAIANPDRRVHVLRHLVATAMGRGDGAAIAREIADPDCRAQAFVSLSDAARDAGDLDAAVDLAQEIHDANRQYEVLSRLVDVFADAGEFERAAAVARTIADPGLRARALADLALRITSRTLLAELLIGEYWWMALGPMQRVDPVAFRQIPDLLLAER